jgi:hypothetical protein
MVLMKNPRDTYQAQVLARQIMGDKAAKFMDMYRRGTARPHGYLVVDLKQETPEHDKLKTGIFGEDTVSALRSTPTLVNSDHAYPMMTTAQSGYPSILKPLVETLKKEPANVYGSEASRGMKSGCPPGILCKQENTMPSCTYCGVVFETYRDLEIHEKKCDHDTSDEEEEPPMKKLQVGTDEWDAWFPIRSTVGEDYRDTIKKEKKKYMKEGYAASPAHRKALNDVFPDARKDMRTALVREWLRWHKLKQNPYFKKFETAARRLRHMEKLSWEEAWSEAVRRHKVLFEYILPYHKVPSVDKEDEPEESESDVEYEDMSEEEEKEADISRE